MSYTHTTVHPPAPTKMEKETFFFGKIVGGQHARSNKKTGEIERWWTGNDGYWSGYGQDKLRDFICKPVL